MHAATVAPKRVQKRPVPLNRRWHEQRCRDELKADRGDQIGNHDWDGMRRQGCDLPSLRSFLHRAVHAIGVEQQKATREDNQDCAETFQRSHDRLARETVLCALNVIRRS
jgi:hypothetical protein